MKRVEQIFETPEAAAERFADGNGAVAKAMAEGPPRALDRGLVNRTFAIGKAPDFALQAVAPMFDDATNRRFNPVAAELARAGIDAPVLLAAGKNTLSLPGPEGRRWRLLSWVPGEAFDAPATPGRAHGAGALLARFHDALWQTEAGGALPLSAFHDTDAYLERLWQTMARADTEVVEAARAIADFWDDWRKSGRATPPRPGHGDLKLSNFIFAPGGERAVGIVDFDTLGRYLVNEEFGDAARSWCNHLPEEEAAARFDGEIFKAMADGYLSVSETLSEAERASLVDGAGRIAIELASRFCIDAVEQSHFAWDAARAPDARTQNLWRAQGQLDLARQIAARRDELEKFIR